MSKPVSLLKKKRVATDDQPNSNRNAMVLSYGATKDNIRQAMKIMKNYSS